MRERRANETNDERKQCELLQYRAATTPKPTIARLPIPAFARERAKRNLAQSTASTGARWCERTRRRGYLQRIVAGAGEGASFDQRAKRRALCVRQRSVDLQQPLEPPAQDVRVIWRVGGTCE